MRFENRNIRQKPLSAIDRLLVSGLKTGMLTISMTVATATYVAGDDGLMASSDFAPMDASGSGLPSPAWAGSPGATQQYFRFLDDSLTGTADFSDNPFGQAGFSVNVDIGQDAWLDPNSAIFTREDNGGAWELDAAGTGEQISFAIPVQDISGTGEGFEGSSIDFLITAVYFEPEFGGFYGIPSLSIEDYEIDGLLESSGIVEDHGSGEWRYLSWTGTVHNVTESDLTFLILGGEGIQGLVDSFEAYTIVPEPRTYAVIFGFLALAMTVIRRRRG